MNPHVYFVAIEPHTWTRDRTYRVYLGEKMLAAAKIAGQIPDEDGFRQQFQGYGALFSPLLKRVLKQRQEKEAFYDALNPFGPELLDADPSNYQILKNDIVSLRFQFKASIHAPTKIGRIDIQTFEGKKRRLQLIGNQDPILVAAQLQQFYPETEIKGKERYLPPTPKSDVATALKDYEVLRFLGLVAVSLALIAGLLWGLGIWQDIPTLKREIFPIGAICGAFGGTRLLFEAWKKKRSLPFDYGAERPHIEKAVMLLEKQVKELK